MKQISFAFMAAALLLLSGCEELENLCGISSEDLGFTEDYTRQLNAAVYIYQQTDRALRDSTLQAAGTAEIDGAMCTRTADSIVIDFGNGVVGNDGKERRGSIRLGYSGNYISAGSTASLVLANYYEGDQNLTGTISLANTSQGNTPIIALTIDEFTANDKTLDGAISASWLSGFETETQPEDDVFELSGGLDLTDATTTNVFNGLFTSPLRIVNNCPYTFESGVVTLTSTVENLTGLSVDFIDGDCANLFQANVDCDGNPLQFYYPIR